ncbi:MAG: hypothetical protein RL701_2373 [Pseudomonadota bacterium]|jgi:hypothetical protein
MKQWRRALAYSFASLCVVSCALTSFTQGYRQNYGISDSEVQRIQFYTSDEIVLQRTSALQERGNVGSAWSITSKTTLREVVIPKGTPVVVLRIARANAEPENADDTRVLAPDGGAPVVAPVEYLQVGLSPTDLNKSLWFSTLKPTVAGRYELTHIAQVQGEQPEFSPGFLVRYDGHDYRLRDQEMWQVHLRFDQDFSAREEVDRVSPPGFRVQERKVRTSTATSE